MGVRAASYVVLAVVLAWAGARAQAEPFAPAVNGVKIPTSMLRYYCVIGPKAYSIGMVACLAKDRIGECRWSGTYLPALPPNRAYWQPAVAPTGECP